MKTNFYIAIKRTVIGLSLYGKLMSPAYGQLTPVNLTAGSFNNDLVAESGNNPQTVTTAAVDGPSGNYVFYSVAFQTANSSVLTSAGLPNSGTFTSGVNSWQMKSYSSNNALWFGPQSATSSASLSLSTPLAYSQISLLDCSGYGPTSVTITLKFTDGSSTNYGSFSIVDWFNGTPYIANSLGRVPRNTTVSNNTAGTNPCLYQTNITLNAADQVKSLSQILIQDNSTNNLSTAAFFALSGIATSTLALNAVDLSGQYNANTHSIGLQWNVDADPNSRQTTTCFVERSTDGVNFTRVASLEAGSQPAYSWTDNNISAGNNYNYRILASTPSGQEVYSNTIEMETGTATSMATVSSVAGMLYVNPGTAVEPTQYAVYSMSGQLYLKGTAPAGNRFEVATSALPHGVYVIRLQWPANDQSVEFLH